MAAKTNSGLAEYAKAQVGKPYWYGTYGQTADESLYKSKKSQYPSYYTASDFTGQYGKRVHDCVGLIKGYLWSDSATATPKYDSSQDKSASGMYAAASTKGKISTFPKTAGLLVFKGSSTSAIHHVGVYGGDGYVYEAKGHAYGVLQTKYTASEWDFWAQCPYCTDDTTGTSSGTSGTSSGTSSDTSSKASSSDLAAGGKVTLSKVNLYASSDAAKASCTKTGTFYLWDTTIKNNRIRITTKASYAGKSGQVTGWIDVEAVTGTTSGSSSNSSSSSKSSGVPTYTTGKVYTTQVDNLNVRTGAGTGCSKVAYKDLTTNAQAHANSSGQLRKGTSVTCRGTKTVDGDVWMQIPSGWVAAWYSGKYYVK